jgi:hypothetical protein
LLVKLKCNRDHICGLNWVRSYMSKDLKYTTLSSVFIVELTPTCAQPRAWQLWQVQNVHNSSSKLDNLFWMKNALFMCSIALSTHPNASKWRPRHLGVKGLGRWSKFPKFSKTVIKCNFEVYFSHAFKTNVLNRDI